MFVDFVTVQVRAGDGGRGIVSFRTEKFIDRGGPDGGDGGHGGDVIFQAQENVNTLAQFRYDKYVRADSGESGSNQKKRGKSADNTTIVVPVGTVIKENDQIIADLSEPGQEAIIAKGGEGGFGNAHFKSSTRQAPRISELGTPGEEKELVLELKLVADVGLVGLPNAGKSTFLSVISNAKPKIANYPFTTLQPNLGVVDVDDRSLIVADIPGLIEGASEGKGLGVEFLRHVERTSVLLHLIDVVDDVEESFRVISEELQQWGTLASKPRIVCLSKVDTVTDKEVAKKVKQLEALWDKPIWKMSSTAHQGLSELLYELKAEVDQDKEKQQAAEALDKGSEIDESATVYELTSEDSEWEVHKVGDNNYRVSGNKIERFGLKTDPSDWAANQRLFNIFKKQGVLHELRRQGYKRGDVVEVAGKPFKEE